jgi:hypothetical protein
MMETGESFEIITRISRTTIHDKCGHAGATFSFAQLESERD